MHQEIPKKVQGSPQLADTVHMTLAGKQLQISLNFALILKYYKTEHYAPVCLISG